jgi:CheY-like chemotaxis protein
MMTKPLLLVVDDDRDLEEPICELAEDMGFEVKFETSAKKFQQTYIATTPAGIVMDIVMPEMDGNELLEWVSQQNRFTPIILISGHDGKYIKVAEMLGKASGNIIVGGLTKPIRLADLELMLQEILDAAQ